jgi:hypothetical protein
MYSRLKREDTPTFRRTQETDDVESGASARGVLRDHLKQELLVGGCVLRRRDLLRPDQRHVGLWDQGSGPPEKRGADHHSPLDRENLPKHNAQASDGSVRRDVQRADALQWGLQRIPGRVGPRGRARAAIMVSLLTWTGTSRSVSLCVFAIAALTFVSAYLSTETYDEEMTEEVAKEEGIAMRG